MHTTKEMVQIDWRLEQAASVKSGSAVPYFSLFSSFLTTVHLSNVILICFPWYTVLLALVTILAFSKATSSRNAE